MNDAHAEPSPDRDPIRAARDEAAAPHVAPADPATTGEQPGDTIGRYKLLQRIGEGGMGTVWMAEQSEPVRRRVALKIIKLGMDTKEVVVRFEAERQALALMEHPGIARVLDGGATTTGRPYFVMELVRGLPITQFCDDGKLDVAARLELFTQVCAAVQHAHQKGVVHRDLKPSNVMVTLHDGTPVPKVIDFGIAKATSAELTQKTLFTQFSQMIGTPEYMAPEQAELSALDVDTRADVYSLGVLLYELLTGTTPFVLREVLERGYAELVRTIREDTPAKPSTRVSTLGETGSNVALRRGATMDRLKTRLRGDLDRIVMKAMEKDRGRRYQTAHGFADDVSRYLRGEPVEAVGPGTVYRLRKFVLRRRKTVAALLLLGLTLVLGATGTAIGWAEARSANASLQTSLHNEAEQRQLAVAEAERATRAEQRARAERDRAVEAENEVAQRAAMLERIATFQERRLAAVDVQAMGARLRQLILDQADADRHDVLADGLAQINLSNVGVGALQHEVLAPTVAAIDASFADDPIVQARLLAAVAQTQKEIGLYREALTTSERALALRSANLPADHEVVIDSILQEASCRLLLGETEHAERMVRDALSSAMAAHEGEPVLAMAQYGLGYTLMMLARPQEAVPHLRAAIAGLPATAGDAHHGTGALARDALAAALAQQSRIPEAEAVLNESIAGLRERYGADSVQVLGARLRLAGILTDSGRAAEAVDIARDAHGKLSVLLGDDNPYTIGSTIALGRALAFANQVDEAETIFTDALARARRTLGERAGFVRTALGGLATVAGQRGDYERARELSAEVWAHSDDAAPRSEDHAAARLNEAIALHKSGDVEAALAAFREARGLAVEIGGREHPIAITAASDIGALLRIQGKVDEALPWLTMASDDAQRVLGPQHRTTWHAQNSLAVLLQALGRHDEADALFERMLRGQESIDPDALNTQVARINLATSRDRLGRPEEAKPLIEAALDRLRTVLPERHPMVLSSRLRLAHTLYHLHDLAAARALCAEVCQAMRETLGPGHFETLMAANTMLLFALAAGDDDAAIAVAQQLMTHEAKQRPNDARFCRVVLGSLLQDRGDVDAAEPLLRAYHELERTPEQADTWYPLLVRNRLAAIAGQRGAFVDGATWMAETCTKLLDAEPPSEPQRAIDEVALALERGVAFYEAWDRAEPGQGHDAEADAVRQRLEERRAEPR